MTSQNISCLYILAEQLKCSVKRDYIAFKIYSNTFIPNDINDGN